MIVFSLEEAEMFGTWAADHEPEERIREIMKVLMAEYNRLKLAEITRDKSGNPRASCCEMMRQNSTLSCGDHTDEHQCPDVLVIHTASGLALPVRDGGGSFLPIDFCPWCATRLDEAFD